METRVPVIVRPNLSAIMAYVGIHNALTSAEKPVGITQLRKPSVAELEAALAGTAPLNSVYSVEIDGQEPQRLVLRVTPSANGNQPSAALHISGEPNGLISILEGIVRGPYVSLGIASVGDAAAVKQNATQ